MPPRSKRTTVCPVQLAIEGLSRNVHSHLGKYLNLQINSKTKSASPSSWVSRKWALAHWWSSVQKRPCWTSRLYRADLHDDVFGSNPLVCRASLQSELGTTSYNLASIAHQWIRTHSDDGHSINIIHPKKSTHTRISESQDGKKTCDRKTVRFVSVRRLYDWNELKIAEKKREVQRSDWWDSVQILYRNCRRRQFERRDL